MRHMSCAVILFVYRLNMRTYFFSERGGYVLCNWKCHAAHTCFFFFFFGDFTFAKVER